MTRSADRFTPPRSLRLTLSRARRSDRADPRRWATGSGIRGLLVSIVGCLLAFSGLPASLALASELAAVIHAPPPSDLSVYQGQWRRIENEDDEAARLRAIDRAVEQMSWLMRRMAASVLRRTTVPPPEVNFEWDGERLHQHVRSDRGSVARRVDPGGNPVVSEDMRGDEFSAAWAWAEAGIQVSWQQQRANGRNVYRVDPADQTLIVEHTINITALDGVPPIVYVSRFGRIDLPAISAGADSAPIGSAGGGQR